MAERLDVAGRLAEGRVAVEHTQAYVRACQATGYAHPDLTSHPSAIRDWFDSEDGLDLHVLDRDCTQLRAAGVAALEGLRIQQDQVAQLAAAWTGTGSDAAIAFLQRHCDTATMVANEVRSAAQRCESLRDNLWHLLDFKVGTAVAIDDRSQAQRAAWLAAAAAVTAGAGQRSTAEQVVRGQVMPYVDNDIRNDWLSAMRSSLAAFGSAYDMVNDRMRAAPAAYFDLPGDLGPGFPPPSPAPAPPAPVPPAPSPAPSPPAVTAPAAVLPSVAEPPPAPTAAAPAAAPIQPAPPLSDLAPPLSDVGAGLGDGSALPAGGGGLGDLGGGSAGLGGLGGLAGRIVDALSGLLGSATDEPGDSPGPDDPVEDPFDDDDPFDPDDEHDDADEEERDEADAEKADELTESAVAQPVTDATPAESPPLPAGGPPPASAPVPAATPAPAAAPAPPTDGATPCEIAADQVPQAGQ